MSMPSGYTTDFDYRHYYCLNDSCAFYRSIETYTIEEIVEAYDSEDDLTCYQCERQLARISTPTSIFYCSNKQCKVQLEMFDTPGKCSQCGKNKVQLTPDAPSFNWIRSKSSRCRRRRGFSSTG